MKISQLSIDGTDIPLTNMVVIVGSNGTGKTRLLEEINWKLTNRGVNTNYWKIDFYESLSDDDILQWLNSLILYSQERNQIWYSPFAKKGNDADGWAIPDNQYQGFLKMTKEELRKQVDSKSFIKEFIHHLPVTERLSVWQSAQITPPGQRVVDPVNILFRNPKIFDEINNELDKLFKKKLTISTYNLPNIELRLIDRETPNAPDVDLQNISKSYEVTLKWLSDNKVSDIGIEGHGILAFLHIMLTYCISLNHVLLIDEPEIHLYPSIKRKFGNTMGGISKENKKQLFCVTHDSDFLQGIFDSKCETTIIKIKKTGKKRELFFKSFDNKSQLNASQNQTSFLQIPFLDAVIIVEGSTDRLVYEYVFFQNGLLNETEYKFISAGGKDSVTNPELIAHNLKVPYGIILDFDVLKSQHNNNLLKVNALNNKEELQNEIQAIGKDLMSIKDIKLLGINAIEDATLKTRILKIVEELKLVGVFIVPIGTLESWNRIDNISKNEFPEKFIEKYQSDKSKFKDLENFLTEIGKYLLKSF